MCQEFLLDTNAFYNLLRAMNPETNEDSVLSSSVENLISKKLIVSVITEIEIISVLGKYARGSQGGVSKCNCRISQEGHICQNMRYAEHRKKWNSKRIEGWMRFINEIFEGRSKLLSVSIEPFDDSTIVEAKKVIKHALVHNFASMDAMIAATAKLAIDTDRNITVVTSDKGLKACLSRIGVPCCDLFATIQVT